MKLLVTVDEIENNKAALLLRCPAGERPLGVFALKNLPADTAVGDILSLSHLKRRREKLQQLGKGSIICTKPWKINRSLFIFLKHSGTYVHRSSPVFF